MTVSEDFEKKWNFPNCVGALDGKHIRITCPKRSGSLYYNYKEYFSIVLLALVDANYKFIFIDVGSFGKEGDAGILAKSSLGKALSTGSFPMPTEKIVAGTNVILPHVILGDEAFQLTSYLMRPFPKDQSLHDENKAIFNLRLCRARRTVENAFGILSNSFRIFHSPINVDPETVDNVVTAACIIHNLLRDEMQQDEETSVEYDASISTSQQNMISLILSNFGRSDVAYEIRDKFTNLFCSPEDMLSWQLNRVRRMK